MNYSFSGSFYDSLTPAKSYLSIYLLRYFLCQNHSGPEMGIVVNFEYVIS